MIMLNMVAMTLLIAIHHPHAVQEKFRTKHIRDGNCYSILV